MLRAALIAAISATPLAAEEITAEVWADNWFALYVNGQKVLEDSVPITTERSFNAETGTFNATLPAQVAFVAKDFKENDTGLEYIGTGRQQMGDGGLIAQFTASSGRVIGVTSSQMRCLVSHHAPVDTSCEAARNPALGQGVCASVSVAEPEGWMLADFDDSGWAPAKEHSESAVRPKDGYDQIDWDRSARIIWTESLTQDNTILCRMTLEPS